MRQRFRQWWYDEGLIEAVSFCGLACKDQGVNDGIGPRSCTRSTPWALHPLLRQFNRRGDAHPRSAGAHVRQGEALRLVAPRIAVRHIERGLEIGEPFARPNRRGFLIPPGRKSW